MGQRATFADVGANGKNGGYFGHNGGNEVENDSYDNDPAAYRVGGTITDTGGGGGCHMFDHLPNGPRGRRVQMGMVRVEQSESVVGQAGVPKGAFHIHLNDGGGDGDGNTQRVFRLERDTSIDPRNGATIEAFYLGEKQWESLVRQLLARVGNIISLPPVAAWSPNKLVSPDGLLEVDIQNRDAFNITLYIRDTPDGPGRPLASLTEGVTAEGRRMGIKVG